jgi:4-hydroxybenzoate polyprenyltransferase
MESRDAAPSVAALPMTSGTLAALAWAGAASTLHRVRRGEGALLAVNLSLVAHRGVADAGAGAQVLVSALTIGLMYALNDLYDAPLDANNPKKDPALIAVYLEHRRTGAVAIALLTLATLALAFATLGGPATAAVAGTMFANVVYSTFLKGVPVVDVVWCGLWGALYAAIVTASPLLLAVVALMTAVCHLYQALDDRAADAANAVITTAVRSPALSRTVLLVLCALLVAALRPPFGGVWALTAVTPLAIFLSSGSARTGWLLTKGYFGVMWLCLLGVAHAAG